MSLYETTPIAVISARGLDWNHSIVVDVAHVQCFFFPVFFGILYDAQCVNPKTPYIQSLCDLDGVNIFLRHVCS